jgi:protein SCO1/2
MSSPIGAENHGWRCPVAVLILIALVAAFVPVSAIARSVAAAEQQRNPVFPAARIATEETAVAGLDERLGARIPLDLVFRDETGRTVRLAELITGPTVILPVYYNCTNVCNYLQGGFARIIPALKGRPGSDYRVISVSFNEDETPELAARYKQMYLTAMRVPFPDEGWRFLTGDSVSIHRLTDSAGYRFQRQGRDFVHPVASFVVSGNGTIVRYLYGTTFLAKDVSLALLEAREGKSGASIRKLVDFCFTYDPAGRTYVFNLLRVGATVVILCAGGFLLFLVLSGKRRTRTTTGGT